MKELLEFALQNGYLLKEFWFYVLDCISCIDHLNIILHGGKSDNAIFQEKEKAQQEKEEKKDHNIQNLISQIDTTIIDKIFNKSVLLDGESIVYFISCLCKCSE